MVNQWVLELRNKWLYPLIDIIEEVDDLDDLPEREKYWINYYYDINPSLLNIRLVVHADEKNHLYVGSDRENFDLLDSVIGNVASILKRGRLCRGITQEEMAQKIGIVRSTLSLLERGENVSLFIVQQYTRELKGIDILTNAYGARSRKSKRKTIKKLSNE